MYKPQDTNRNISYSGLFSREKIFTNFVDFGPSTKISSPKSVGVASAMTHKQDCSGNSKPMIVVIPRNFFREIHSQ